MEDSDGGWVVEVEGLRPGELERLRALDTGAREASLRVFTAEALASTEAPPSPPVLGELRLSGDRLRWTPAFPLVEGREHVARWSSSGADEEPLEHRFLVPRGDAADPPRVTAVHPEAEVVPENLLRVYVHFSRSMRGGRVGEQVRVLADGRRLAGALVAAESELWNPTRDRLTLLFDPGRIKQQVGPNLDVGTPLRAGMSLELRIEPGWPDDAGGTTDESFGRRWTVGPADREQPSVSSWEIAAPAGVDEAVRIAFPEPLDAALLTRLLAVESAEGDPVSGHASVGSGGREWAFRPDDGWRPGGYRVRVGSELEDLAGNSLERLFDEPLDETRVGESELPDATLTFEVRAS